MYQNDYTKSHVNNIFFWQIYEDNILKEGIANTEVKAIFRHQNDSTL